MPRYLDQDQEPPFSDRRAMTSRPSFPAIGVCSWSLQVRNIPELVELLRKLDLKMAQIACGDPHHASWDEADNLPAVARSSGIAWSGAMLGFDGEDYTTPTTIRHTGGFGDPQTRAERLDKLAWGLERTKQMGLADLSFHAGYLPAERDAGRRSFLDTLARAGRMAEDYGVTLAFETGQETAHLLRRTLDDLAAENLKVNFDPANMLLYDQGDPIEAVEILGPDIRSVHAKDARRPEEPGQWGQEVPLGQGEVNFPRFLKALKSVAYAGPLVIERERGDKAARFHDIEHGVRFLENCLRREER